MTVRFPCLVAFFFLNACGSLSLEAQTPAPGPAPVTFAIASPASWIQSFRPDLSAREDDSSDGVSYLLLDQQENIEPRASYYHQVRRITSESGVQGSAAISVSFDPSYQRLVFHWIRVIRQGTTADRLDRSHIKLFQREQELEYFLYDGSYTARCDLEDVRVGDVIDYAYTVEGGNPVFAGKYFNVLSTDYSDPVRRMIARLVYPSERKLQFRIRNREIKPAVSTRNGTTEWLWDETDVPSRRSDPNTPVGYNAYGSVQVSDFADWAEVVKWALPLYQTDAILSPEMEAEIEKLRAIAEPDERTRAALRFVQDEIRYLGIESGVGSHQPTAPGEVLRRRFGDCKDKTHLLGTLLRKCGLKAHPALVSSGYRRSVAERLPSPGAFNHVILQLDTGKGTHWLDATRGNQRGPLSHIYVGNFGYALVLREGTTDLTALAPPPDALPRKRIVENYRIRAPDGDARLETITEYHGLLAEQTRASFRNTNREKIEKDYLEFYARRFPAIKVARPVQFEELPGEVGCKVTEHYVIPGMWQLDDDKQKYSLLLYPTDIANEVGTPGSSQRSDPLGLNFPVDTIQEINAEMFEDWNLEEKTRDVSNAFFRFHAESKVSGPRIRMTYSYQSLVDHIPVGDLMTYDTALRKIPDLLGYSFTYRTPAQLKQQGHGQFVAQEFNWPIAVLLALVLGAAAFLSFWYCRASKLAAPLPPPLTRQSLEGIGGWLFLVAFGLFVRPVLLLTTTISLFPSVFQLGTWRVLTQAGQPTYHPMWMPALLFELFFNSVAFVFSVLLLILFFKKRAAWPHAFIAFFVFLLVGVFADLSLIKSLPPAAESVGESIKAAVQVAFAAAIEYVRSLINSNEVLFYSDHLDTWSMGDSFERFLRPRTRRLLFQSRGFQLYLIRRDHLRFRLAPRNEEEHLFRALLHSARSMYRSADPDALLLVLRDVFG